MSEVQATPTPTEASSMNEAVAELENGSGEINPAEAQEAPQSTEEQIEEIQESEELSASEKKEAIKDLKKKLKLKVDGKEIEREIDFNDDESLTRELQKAAAFEKRAQEYANLRKQATEFIEQLKSNPANVLGQLGINVEELSEQILRQKVEEMQKSPEQLEREKMQRELEEYKAELERQRREAEEARLEKLKNQYASEIENDITEALGSGKTVLPKSPLVIKRIAETMALAMQNGYTNVKAADVIPIVEKQFRKELSDLFGVLPEETLEEVVGKNNLERIRKKRVKQSKPAVPTIRQVAKTTGQMPKSDEESGAKKPDTSFRKYFKGVF